MSKGRFVKIKHESGGYGFVFDRDAPPTTDEMLANAAVELAAANARIRELESLPSYKGEVWVDTNPVALPAQTLADAMEIAEELGVSSYRVIDNVTMTPARCRYHSRAYGCRCELEPGHDGWCQNGGDGFASGYDPDDDSDSQSDPERCPICNKVYDNGHERDSSYECEGHAKHI